MAPIKSPVAAAHPRSAGQDRRQGKNKNDCQAVCEWWLRRLHAHADAVACRIHIWAKAAAVARRDIGKEDIDKQAEQALNGR